MRELDAINDVRRIIRSLRQKLDDLEAKIYQITPASRAKWKRIPVRPSWKLANDAYEKTMKTLAADQRKTFKSIHAALRAQTPPASVPTRWQTFAHAVSQYRRLKGLPSHQQLHREGKV